MGTYHPYSIFPLGDSALTIEFSTTIHIDTHRKVMALFHQLQKASIPYITDLVPAYSAITVFYDAAALLRSGHSAFERMAEMIENLTEEKMDLSAHEPALIEIPVCYERAFAPDIDAVGEHNHLSPDEIIALHSSSRYHVYMLGFQPGFAYMGSVDEKLLTPRKSQPVKVAPGAVGIAGGQTGIYPFETWGGWQIIGQTPLAVFDREWTNPSIFQPGDQVKFYSITADEFKDYQRRDT